MTAGTPTVGNGNLGRPSLSTGYCTACSKSTEGSFCSDCGAPSISSPPPSGPPLAPTGPRLIDNTFAWCLAFAPLLLILVDGVLGGSAGPSVIAAIAINSGLAIADSRRLKASGVDVSGWLAVFLVPVYLFIRQARARQPYTIPIIWCVCFLVSLGGAGIVANVGGVHMDGATVEQSIIEEYARSGRTVSVDCPSVTAEQGSTFQCVVRVNGVGSTIADVTIQNSAGDFVWQAE